MHISMGTVCWEILDLQVQHAVNNLCLSMIPS